MDCTSLCIASYNSTGLSEEKTGYIRQLLDDCHVDILLLQEHWLLSGNLARLGSIHKDFMFYGVSGVKEECSSVIYGRPYGGVALLWRKSLALQITRVKQNISKRLCAIHLSSNTKDYLLINLYMPVDSYSKTSVREEFLEVCDEVEILINKYPNHTIIIGGDLNADFLRHNAHDVYFKNLLDRHDMNNCWNLTVARPDFTYVNQSSGAKSTIDHICMTTAQEQLVREAYVCEDALNPSDHRPVIIIMDIDTSHAPNCELERQSKSPIMWHKVNDDHIQMYKTVLADKLKNIMKYDVKLCDNVNCNEKQHKIEIDQWCKSIIESCILSDSVFPRKRKYGPKCMPGWHTEVKRYSDECKWWFNLWRDLGKPPGGVVFDNMKESKRQYRYAVRRCKRKERELRFQKMVEYINEDKSRDFFRELKRLNGGNCSPTCINGKTDAKDIAEVFAQKYNSLYNSVPYCKNNMDHIERCIEDGIENCNENCFIDVEMVKNAVDRLKYGKSDANNELLSNHLLLAGEVLYKELSNLLTAILTHGHHPEPLLLATIHSIPKDNRGDLTDDNNYRGIALTSSIGKVIDIVFLLRNEHKLQTTDLQYAFKEQHSTTMCTLLVKEIVKHYIENDSYVAACFIDAKKAFDRVKLDKLFLILLDRQLPIVDIRALLNLYKRQYTRTVWKGQYSEYFTSVNGIRQGSISSPILYCLYMDELIKELKMDGTGCWMGENYCGAISYADDLTLLSPSVNGLKKMMYTCEKYGVEYGVEYNPTKSVCVMFGRGNTMIKPQFYLCNKEIKVTEHVKHLGNHIMFNLKESKEINAKKSDMVGRLNVLIANLQNAPESVLVKAFNVNCCHFYGAQAWNLCSKDVKQFYTMWNRCVRRILKLPYTTHVRFLPKLIQCPHAWEQVSQRFVNMVKAMLNSNNKIIRFIAKSGMNNRNTIIGSNLWHITSNAKCDAMLGNIKFYNLSEEESATVQVIQELRDAGQLVDNFTSSEQISLLYFCCTS